MLNFYKVIKIYIFFSLLIVLIPLANAKANKIIGGQNALFRDFPFVGLSNITWNAGGLSIIAPRWVLTAAHVTNVPAIYVGSSRPDSQAMKRFEVEERFDHPMYSGLAEDGYDIALLKLRQPIDLVSTGIKPVRLADPAFVSRGGEKVGVTARVLGWGYDGVVEPGRPSEHLKSVEIPVQSVMMANRAISYDGMITASMLPAGFIEGGKDACIGDSGGPLVVRDKLTHDFVQIGIVSWGEQCALAYKFGIYTRVSSYYRWIQSVVGDELVPKIQK